MSKSRLSCLPGVAAEDEELALTINLAAASMDHGYHLPPPAHLQPGQYKIEYVIFSCQSYKPIKLCHLKLYGILSMYRTSEVSRTQERVLIQ